MKEETLSLYALLLTWGLSFGVHAQTSFVPGQQAMGQGGPHAITSSNGASYVYDANGDLTHVTGAQNLTHEYTVVRKLKRATSDQGEIKYFYTATGEKVATHHVVQNRKEVFTGEIRFTNDVPRFTYAGDAETSEPGDDVNFFLRDHLGSILASVNAHSVLERKDHLPYGESWYQVSSAATDRDFNGNLKEGQLLDYNARHYLPEMAHFIQADSVIPHMDSLGFNRYAYVSNNPVNRIDPSGHADFFNLSRGSDDYFFLERSLAVEMADDFGVPSVDDLAKSVGHHLQGNVVVFDSYMDLERGVKALPGSRGADDIVGLLAHGRNPGQNASKFIAIGRESISRNMIGQLFKDAGFSNVFDGSCRGFVPENQKIWQSLGFKLTSGADEARFIGTLRTQLDAHREGLRMLRSQPKKALSLTITERKVVARWAARHGAELASWVGLGIMLGLAGDAFATGDPVMGSALLIDAANPIPLAVGAADMVEVSRDPEQAQRLVETSDRAFKY